MPKTILPMLATLALCGAAAVAVIATTAHAQPEPRKPMLIAANTPDAVPSENGGMPAMRRRAMPAPGEIAERIKQACEDSYAREAGAMTYLDIKLGLSAAQKAGFERWKTARLDIAKRRAGSCAAMERPRAAGERPSVVEMMARREEMLKRQLADISAERPALEAFYKSLNADQQREFTRAAERRLMERAPMMTRRIMGSGPGMMDHMMHRGPMPAEAPPAPPPQ